MDICRALPGLETGTVSILGLKGQPGGGKTQTQRQRGLGEGHLAGADQAEDHQHLDRASLLPPGLEDKAVDCVRRVSL